ncbi:hypothetical protein MHH42_31355 [Bacillus sp. FSL L8-0099]|uniref:hypothetical protein n=1 Tax=unclassified Bacillus (in: firmicutes) TaxID=185979 RepID=UPI0030F56FCA
MHRKSFTDRAGKKGKIGSIVRSSPYKEDKTVKEIISKGAGGTRVYFEEGGYDKASYCEVVKY